MGRTIYGVDNASMLIAFGALRPDLVSRRVAIAGLQTGEQVLGIDFRPMDGRLYALGSTSRVYTLDTLTGATAAVDSALAYRAGDAGAGVNPNVTGTAYTNSVVGATTTTLYAIDTNRDVLVTLPNPNDGQLSTVGALGVNTSADVGFDIAGNNGTAVATLAVGSGAGGTGSTLFLLNLSTGALFPVGDVANTAPLRGIAIAP